MRSYELIFIVHPELDEAAFMEVVERVKGWVGEDGGKVEKIDLWGKRRLSYPIRKQKDGQYVLMVTQMQPSANARLERNLRLLEPVMRFSIIAQD